MDEEEIDFSKWVLQKELEDMSEVCDEFEEYDITVGD